MHVLESAIERKCKKLAEEHGCILLKIQGTKGFPDRLLIGPHGQMMWFEFKREGETMRPLQKEIQLKLTRMGHSVQEVDNPILFLALLQKLGLPTPIKKGVSNG